MNDNTHTGRLANIEFWGGSRLLEGFDSEYVSIYGIAKQQESEAWGGHVLTVALWQIAAFPRFCRQKLKAQHVFSFLFSPWPSNFGLCLTSCRCSTFSKLAQRRQTPQKSPSAPGSSFRAEEARVPGVEAVKSQFIHYRRESSAPLP